MSACRHIVDTVNSRTVQHVNSWVRSMRLVRSSVRKCCLLLVLFVVNFLVLVLTSHAFVSRASSEAGAEEALAYGADEVVNVDGDVSLSEAENRICWNPHVVGLTNASAWTVTFANEMVMSLETGPQEAGHVAAGAWWTTGFKSKSRIPLCALEPQRILVSFRAVVVAVHCQTGDEWLRIALACAVRRGDGTVVYTEMDFWDSSVAMRHSAGDVRFGGDVVYRGGDVVEYKIDQAVVGEWESYSFDLTRRIDSAWTLRQGDLLESVYVVVEVEGSVSVALKVDDLWIARLS
jgi:hypothetical protein